jgi:pSer/pThr/pTyr-binding forkhead associated (FHA) protein
MARPERGALHCPECGFVNPEGANYCQKCGAFLGEPGRESGGEGEATAAYQVDESGELRPVDLEQITAEGATLVIRSGGGRAGEAFTLEGEQTRVGRSPDADVFLDDVTVSRNHALLVRRRDGLYIDDLGSLNGTYVNRRRIESHKLQNGDELQVGKYKLTYLDQ